MRSLVQRWNSILAAIPLLIAALAIVACSSTPTSRSADHDGRMSEGAMDDTPVAESGAATAAPTRGVATTDGGGFETVAIPSPGSPLVAIRLQFDAGSIYDPQDKKGLAALTTAMIGTAGTTDRTYSDVIDALYPMAASIEAHCDREVAVISGEIHRDNLGAYLDLLEEALVSPGFRAEDFDRNREFQTAYLSSTLRATNDELLGLEMTQQILFQGHPYEHSPAGTETGLAAIAIDDIRAFYREHYTRSKLTLGVAGGYQPSDLARLQSIVGQLPTGTTSTRRALPEPAMPEGREFHLIQKQTASVGIHLAFPISVTRADPDYYPLMVANSFLGEHRTFHGRLMQQLRGKRGLNYGDYSYIEYWDQPPFTTNPSPNVPRRQQYFSVWIRPVVPNTAHFALRNAVWEIDRLLEVGMTEDEFEITRDFLINYSKLWAQTLADRLGFHMDSRFYGLDGYYIDEIETRLRALDVEAVNAALRRHIQTERFHAVFVTDGASDVQAYLEADEPSPMEYNTPPAEDVARDDELIQVLSVIPDRVEISNVEDLFTR